MKFIICIDDKNGMLFFGKRQSQDRELVEQIIRYINPSRLFVSDYSQKLFADYKNVVVSDNYLSEATADDYCFVENIGYETKKADEFIICKWNRKYQADVFFDTDLKSSGFKKIESFDIKGRSHKKITIETYKRG